MKSRFSFVIPTKKLSAYNLVGKTRVVRQSELMFLKNLEKTNRYLFRGSKLS